MTYLKNCLCFKGSLPVFPFASFCGGGTVRWSLLAILALTVRSHPGTLRVQSSGLPLPMGANLDCVITVLRDGFNTVVSSRFHFYMSL